MRVNPVPLGYEQMCKHIVIWGHGKDGYQARWRPACYAKYADQHSAVTSVGYCRVTSEEVSVGSEVIFVPPAISAQYSFCDGSERASIGAMTPVEVPILGQQKRVSARRST